MAIEIDRKGTKIGHRVSGKEVVLTEYVRPADVVRSARVSKTVVMEAIWSGRLEAYRVGRAWVIPTAAVDRWIRGEDAGAA